MVLGQHCQGVEEVVESRWGWGEKLGRGQSLFSGLTFPSPARPAPDWFTLCFSSSRNSRPQEQCHQNKPTTGIIPESSLHKQIDI